MSGSYFSFSSLLTTTTSRVATIRQNLLAGENDGDTVQDTHICRVLRAYYTEKGRGFPGWLPPDPKGPMPTAPVYTSNVGAGYGGGLDQGAGGSKLNTLWDNQKPAGQPVSLRAGGRSPAPLRQAAPSPFTKTPSPAQQVVPRELPSQQARSQQNASRSQAEKLKSRFQSGERSTPPPTAPAASKYGPSAGRADYEARFAPPENGYGGTRSGSASKQPDYAVSANSPWASNEPALGGGGYSDGLAGLPVRQGRQSGPAAGNRGPGLPSGPRGYK